MDVPEDLREAWVILFTIELRELRVFLSATKIFLPQSKTLLEIFFNKQVLMGGVKTKYWDLNYISPLNLTCYLGLTHELISP